MPDTLLPTHAPAGFEHVHRTLPIALERADLDALLRDMRPYLAWIEHFLASGTEFPSHIPGSGCLAVPVGETMTPEEMFAVLGDRIRYEVSEYDDFWITVHYPNPEPVVTLLPKTLPGVPAAVSALTARCADAMGCPVGGADGTFIAYLLPGFSWAMHTDHDNDYELVDARLHVPLLSSPDNLFVWGRKHDDGREEWLVRKHLAVGGVHYVRVDVPHTVVNNDPTRTRLHLIMDVHHGGAAERYRPLR